MVFKNSNLAVAPELCMTLAWWFPAKTVPSPPRSNDLDQNVASAELRRSHWHLVCYKGHVSFKVDWNRRIKKKKYVEELFLLPVEKPLTVKQEGFHSHVDSNPYPTPQKNNIDTEGSSMVCGGQRGEMGEVGKGGQKVQTSG